MKLILLIAAAVCMASAQRPFYAGKPNRYPEVLPQYLPQEQQTSSNGLVNRIDTETSSTTTTTLPPDLPIDALGDVDLVNRIKTWPREQWPFWYLNWRQIEEHRGSVDRVQPQPNNRPFFAG